MDFHNEELQAKFLSGMDELIPVLYATIGRLHEARLAARAKDPAAAFRAYSETLGTLREMLGKLRAEQKA